MLTGIEAANAATILVAFEVNARELLIKSNAIYSLSLKFNAR